MTWTKLRTVRGHTGVARFLAEVGEEVIGWARMQPDIDSPYAYATTRPVFLWQDTPIVMVEVAHGRTVVFRVPRTEVYATEDEAFSTTPTNGD